MRTTTKPFEYIYVDGIEGKVTPLISFSYGLSEFGKEIDPSHIICTRGRVSHSEWTGYTYVSNTSIEPFYKKSECMPDFAVKALANFLNSIK